MVKITRDILWKAIIEDFFEDFLLFFYPQHFEEINFSKGFEFLNKELERLLPDSTSKGRRADLLVKVFLKNGQEQWLLIHIEVQGYYDADINYRVFTTYYRIYDRYKVPINCLVIYSDEYPNYQPDSFGLKCFKTELKFKFDIYKLLEQKPDQLQKQQNVFADILEIAWYGIKPNQPKDEKLLEIKTQIFRRLLNRGYPKGSIRRLLDFIRFYLPFENLDNNLKFEEHIDQITKTRKVMGILETVEAAYKEHDLNMVKKAIQNMLAKKFSMKDISEILEVPVDLIEQVKKESEENIKKK